MFKRNTTMAKVDPVSWRHIIAAKDGTVSRPDGEYIFRVLDPQRDISDPRSPIVSGQVNWTVVAVVPHVTLADIWHRESVPVGMAGLLILAVMSWGWSKAVVARRDAEAEMMRVEKLAGLGGLVAGVAHELNTPIGNAVLIASSLNERIGAFDAAVAEGQIKRSTIEKITAEMIEGTRIIGRCLERAATLIGHFKQVAVDQASEQRRDFQLAEMVDCVFTTMQPQFAAGRVRLSHDIDPTITLNSYPGPLGQVLINLIVNAQLHAFAEGEAGQITVSARNLDEDMLQISVRDNGCGIPLGIQMRIFEPFFTTRLGTGGNGLGLSIVHNIVSGMLGGTIKVHSRPGKGTWMELRLARIAPDVMPQHTSHYAAQTSQAA